MKLYHFILSSVMIASNLIAMKSPEVRLTEPIEPVGYVKTVEPAATPRERTIVFVNDTKGRKELTLLGYDILAYKGEFYPQLEKGGLLWNLIVWMTLQGILLVLPASKGVSKFELKPGSITVLPDFIYPPKKEDTVARAPNLWEQHQGDLSFFQETILIGDTDITKEITDEITGTMNPVDDYVLVRINDKGVDAKDIAVHKKSEEIEDLIRKPYYRITGRKEPPTAIRPLRAGTLLLPK